MWALINTNSTHPRCFIYFLLAPLPRAGGSGAVVVSLSRVLPVLIEGQVEISLKGAVGRGEGRAGCFGPLSMTCNLIWFEFGMHPLVGQSLGECDQAFLLPLSVINSKQYVELLMADFNVKTLNFITFSHHAEILWLFNLKELRLEDLIGICLVFAAYQTAFQRSYFQHFNEHALN